MAGLFAYKYFMEKKSNGELGEELKAMPDQG
jgi:hypothetical protein